MAIVDESRQLLTDHEEDVLQDILDIGRLQLVLAQPGTQPRLIHGQQPLPGLRIVLFPEPVEQTLRGWEHGRPLLEPGKDFPQ